MHTLRNRLFWSSCFAALISLAGACGDDDGDHDSDHDHDHDLDAASSADASADAGPSAVSIQFAGRVAGEAFACGTTYEGVGSTRMPYVGADFRLYLSNLALVTSDNQKVPLELTANDHQTVDGIALLDFEDGSGPCEMGSSATYTTIVGTVPAGDYTGISFDVAVPEASNHLDPAGVGAPLNEPGMSWAWQFGYKFIKIDGIVNGDGFNIHVGSTGCPGRNAEQPPTESCANPNAMAVTLPEFNAATQTIVIDVANILSDADVSENTADTAPGCMSFPGDPECAAIFPKLGLPFDEVPAATQTLFTVE